MQILEVQISWINNFIRDCCRRFLSTLLKSNKLVDVLTTYSGAGFGQKLSAFNIKERIMAEVRGRQKMFILRRMKR